MIAAWAPDLSAVMTKMLYARDRWRDTEWPPAWWNAVLEDIARLGGGDIGLQGRTA